MRELMSNNIPCNFNINDCNGLSARIGTALFQWVDVDYLQVTNRYGRTFKITGGDFESMLDVLESVAGDN